jgi:Positive regulator of sigma E activity
MKQQATVEEVKGNMAKIKVKRDSACAGCKSADLCASCVKTVTADAVNNIGAVVGDTVNVESESGTILKYAVLTFIVPIVCALAAYFITASILSSELISNISMAAGFIIPLVTLALVVKNKKICDITITSIVENNAETGVQNNEQQ